MINLSFNPTLIPTNMQAFKLDKFFWNSSYKVPSEAYMSPTQEGLYVQFKVYEDHPYCIHDKHMSKTCEDSCVELFLAFNPHAPHEIFVPQTGLHPYFNFELNAKGFCYAKFGALRQERVPLNMDDFASLKIKVQQDPKFYTLSFIVTNELMQKYLGYLPFTPGNVFAFNLYKICETQKYLHFACFKPLSSKTPNFHVLEDFALATIK